MTPSSDTSSHELTLLMPVLLLGSRASPQTWPGRAPMRTPFVRNPDCPVHAGNRSPERAEELAHVADEQVRGLHGGEVAAAVELGPVLDLVLGVHHLPHERLGREERPTLRRRAG